jgi:hypothetical protein
LIGVPIAVSLQKNETAYPQYLIEKPEDICSDLRAKVSCEPFLDKKVRIL